jgi:hypothetical protein
MKENKQQIVKDTDTDIAVVNNKTKTIHIKMNICLYAAFKLITYTYIFIHVNMHVCEYLHMHLSIYI